LHQSFRIALEKTKCFPLIMRKSIIRYKKGKICQEKNGCREF
jgi:hypothetical protein